MLKLPPSEDLPELNQNPFFHWNHAGLEMNRVTHSIGGPQGGPTMSSRALGLLHLAMHDAYFAIRGAGGPYRPYLPAAPIGAIMFTLPPLNGAADAVQALAGAAIRTLDRLYGGGGTGISIDANQTLVAHLDALVKAAPGGVDVLSASYAFGEKVADAVLGNFMVRPGEPGADPGRYMPRTGHHFFRDEPTHPVRLAPVDPNAPNGAQKAVRMYHGPFYGQTARVIGAQGNHVLANPPVTGAARYTAALKEVIAVGGAPGLNGTRRTPDQTTAGYYWAYDGTNLVGAPPRLYNQILRVVASSQLGLGAGAWSLNEDQTDEVIRLFALANVAMSDAGVFCWREKYHFEFWRPLTGVREHDAGCGPSATSATATANLAPHADPFWLTLGAPETNSHKTNFKPPFPAYPSGHATFGAAAFHVARLFYAAKAASKKSKKKSEYAKDDLAFSFVSDELNGISRDLDQPYDKASALTDQPGAVRTRVVRRFDSLWRAIFENAYSRIYLGVHWSFDAYLLDGANPDVPDPCTPQACDPIVPTYDPDGGDPDFATGPRSPNWPDGPSSGKHPFGGVPLGLAIAKDVFGNGLTATNVDPVLGPASNVKRNEIETPAAPCTGISPVSDGVRPKSSNTHVTL